MERVPADPQPEFLYAYLLSIVVVSVVHKTKSSWAAPLILHHSHTQCPPWGIRNKIICGWLYTLKKSHRQKKINKSTTTTSPDLTSPAALYTSGIFFSYQMQRRLPWVCHQCSLRQSSWCRHWWTSWLWCQTPLLFLCGTWSGRRNCERTQTHHRQNGGGGRRDELEPVNHEYAEATRHLNGQTHFSENYCNSEGTLDALYVQTDALFSQHTDGDTNPAETQHKDNTSRWCSSYSLTYASPKMPFTPPERVFAGTMSDAEWHPLIWPNKIILQKSRPQTHSLQMHPFAFSDSLYVFVSTMQPLS